jgi:PAS domain S-box-containing protein
MLTKIRTMIRSLSAQLILTFVVAIVATTIAAGIPSYWSIQSELEHQAWKRVSNGSRVTQALIEAEKIRLNSLSNHAAQRPTLQKIVRENNEEVLSSYLQDFQAGVNLDFIVISDGMGQIIIETIPLKLPLELTQPIDAGFYPCADTKSELCFLATQAIPGNPDQDAVFVTVGIFIDAEFASQLANESGFEQSILISDVQTASSLEGMPADRSVGSKGYDVDQNAFGTITFQDSRYYTIQIPLYDPQHNLVAMDEIALPVDELDIAKRRSILILGISTLLIAGVGSLLGSITARRLIAPLKQLTAAAINISQGDLDTPIPIPKNPDEIVTLATAFEESRFNTHRVLEDLSRAKNWSDTLIRSVAEGIVTIDSQGQITSFNQGAERITGWKSEEVIGQSINQVFQLANQEGNFTENIHPGSGLHHICILNGKGQEIVLAVTGANVRLSNEEESAQTALVLRDITEEEAAQRLRSYFLANISHEFRTPLSALNASVELLLEDIADLSLAEIVELLNSVHFSVASLQALIDNLLESTNIAAGYFHIRRRPTEIYDIIAEATRIIQPLFNRRHQILSQNIASDLPLVNVDPTRLTQVLVNLLSNASKYSPMEENIGLNLDIRNGRNLHIAVYDRGPGISPADRSNLFRRFVRLGDQDEAQYGVGLGLSVVKTIVEEHGGEVGVDARNGGGSIFWLTIPLNGESL